MGKKSTLDLNRYIPALITFFSNKMSTGASQLYSHLFDKNVIDWRIISMLAVEPNISARRICQVIGLDKGSVSRTLAKLKEQNLVQINADKRDTRATKIVLTDLGYALHEEMYQIAMEREAKIFGILNKQDQEHLIRILNVLNAHIEDTNEYFIEKYIDELHE